MWQQRQLALLKEEIEAVLAPLEEMAVFYTLVKEPLSGPKRGLADGDVGNRQWPILLLMVCEAISGRFEQALSAAAAMQCFMAAADVFDDIEDEDSPEAFWVRHGRAVATNVATALVMIAERAITRLKEKGVEPHVVVRAMDAVNEYHIMACAGQHLDISLTTGTAISEDMYLKVIGMKSAYAAECACHIGALLANASQELVDTFAAFGRNLGMASQIANDIQGITQGRDISKRKITLPVIYALAQTNGEAHHQLELAFGKCSEASPQPEGIRDLLFRTGAIHYATVKAETYWQRARDILGKIGRAGVSVERIEPFVK